MTSGTMGIVRREVAAMHAHRKNGRLAPVVVALTLAASALALAGCAGSTNAPGASGGTNGSPGAGQAVMATVTPPATVAKRLADKMAFYDEEYVRVEDMSSVRETYGIDITFPEVAAGGQLAGLWMQVPDVDGGEAIALYHASGVEIEVWITPSLAVAQRWVKRGNGRGDFSPEETSATVSGYAAFVRPRVWLPERAVHYVGVSSVPAGWSQAEIRWAQGQCVVTVTSTERDAEDLLGVAQEVKITGEVRMPKPVKKK